MSHTTAVTTDFKNKPALAKACERIGAKIDTAVKSVRLYQGQTPCDTSVQLKGWDYPLAVNTTTGKVQFDNYNGAWGNIKEFQNLRQEYSVAVVEQEQSVQEMLNQGWSLERQPLPNGDIKLMLNEPQF